MTDEHGYGEGHSVWAMPIFMVSEALLFFGFRGVLGLEAFRVFMAACRHSGDTALMPIIMTVVLCLRALRYTSAEERMDHDDHGGFVQWLVITMILGGAFLGMSVYEWTGLFREGFIPSTNVYSTAFSP